MRRELLLIREMIGAADRIRLVTNLMTVLVGDSEAQPVLSVDHT